MASTTATVGDLKTAIYDDHCWHGVGGAAILTHPPVYPCQCCRCGARGEYTTRREPMPGHGPYVLADMPVYPKRAHCYPRT